MLTEKQAWLFIRDRFLPENLRSIGYYTSGTLQFPYHTFPGMCSVIDYLYGNDKISPETEDGMNMSIRKLLLKNNKAMYAWDRNPEGAAERVKYCEEMAALSRD